MHRNSTCQLARAQRPGTRIAPALARRRDNAALAHRAAAGDQRAWSLLLGRFDATIRAVARRHQLSPADQDEVAQRTWLALLRHIDRVKDHPALAGWLITTARRECYRVRAVAEREAPLDDFADPPNVDSVAPEEHVLSLERCEALHRALERLPRQQRVLMRLLLDQPALSHEQISAELGIARGSVGPTRGRCIARLRNDRQLESVVHGLRESRTRRPAPGHDLS